MRREILNQLRGLLDPAVVTELEKRAASGFGDPSKGFDPNAGKPKKKQDFSAWDNRNKPAAPAKPAGEATKNWTESKRVAGGRTGMDMRDVQGKEWNQLGYSSPTPKYAPPRQDYNWRHAAVGTDAGNKWTAHSNRAAAHQASSGRDLKRLRMERAAMGDATPGYEFNQRVTKAVEGANPNVAGMAASASPGGLVKYELKAGAMAGALSGAKKAWPAVRTAFQNISRGKNVVQNSATSATRVPNPAVQGTPPASPPAVKGPAAGDPASLGSPGAMNVKPAVDSAKRVISKGKVTPKAPASKPAATTGSKVTTREAVDTGLSADDAVNAASAGADAVSQPGVGARTWGKAKNIGGKLQRAVGSVVPSKGTALGVAGTGLAAWGLDAYRRQPEGERTFEGMRSNMVDDLARTGRSATTDGLKPPPTGEATKPPLKDGDRWAKEDLSGKPQRGPGSEGAVGDQNDRPPLPQEPTDKKPSTIPPEKPQPIPTRAQAQAKVEEAQPKASPAAAEAQPQAAQPAAEPQPAAAEANKQYADLQAAIPKQYFDDLSSQEREQFSAQLAKNPELAKEWAAHLKGLK